MRARLIAIFSLILLTTGAVAPVTANTGTSRTVHSANTMCSFPITVTDATGTQITITQEPQRVVTLNPSAAQMMWEIGGKSKVVGASQYAAYLDGASSRTNISGSGNAYVSEEKVVKLKPDLVLAPDTVPNSTVQKLRQANVIVYRYRAAASMTDIKNQTRLTGKLTGECSGARQAASQMQSRLATIHHAVNGTNRPRVLYTFFGYTAGKGTFINQIITTAGGDNVAADAGISGYKKISKETIVNQNPQWIIRNDQQPTVPHTPAYNSTGAVKHGNVIVLNRNYISQPAPRVIQPITKLAKKLHPDAYAATNVSTTLAGPNTTQTGNANTSTSTTSTSESEQETTSTSNPGFGVGIALVGIVGTLIVIAMRRNT
ncbi:MULTISPECIES: PGF-CTERM-anchored ABC transporter substrate-binding protein [unclassified Haladaptatus]|uniref:PGF-CTERM-anchored ABC transporter substrate-binding protein n=1 Tax=unclassified Haladaptatus TaxID=2622732 RepID=UPI00209C222B|nr:MULTISPECIES: PGF-CTERM-anchored ABC transporter substrate-binding protein [unclassified Haladaptatus]MCO8245452.1 PGF-CTERM-anchored ABC transporter substrate-binding protein [Haladaptatus sp. AB643]MCO8256564.1 PGF-CTERM-anchored ABC transporter substrate-binding protein [Haladaptatus sp. AB618]